MQVNAEIVTAVEVSRDSRHVFVEGRKQDGTLVYSQMIPIKDFNAKRFLGQFEWGRKVDRKCPDSTP